MTADQVATVIELALYRVADRLKRAPDDRPVSASAIATALRETGYEIASLVAGHKDAR